MLETLGQVTYFSGRGLARPYLPDVPADRLKRSCSLVESEALIADLECLSKEVPDAKRHAGNFEPAEAVKSVPLDPSGDTSKQIRIGSGLDPK